MPPSSGTRRGSRPSHAQTTAPAETPPAAVRTRHPPLRASSPSAGERSWMHAPAAAAAAASARVHRAGSTTQSYGKTAASA